MKYLKKFSLVGIALLALLALVAGPAAAQQQKPNILFIMGDDIGWMQPSIYHRGLMVGRNAQHRPHRQRRRALHGLLRRAELHLRAQRLLHRHASAAHGHDPAATSRQPVLPAARHAGARVCSCAISATTPASSARTTWATIRRRCRRRTASRSSGATCITSTQCRGSASPTSTRPRLVQGIAPPCKTTPVKGLPEVPGAVDPEDRELPDAAAPGDRVHLFRRHGGEPDAARTKAR